MNFQQMREQTDRVRSIPLPCVLLAVGAKPDRGDKSKWHTPQGVISVTGCKFMNWNSNTGGGGAIDLVIHLNRKLVGWSRYFCLGPVSKAYRSVDAHTRFRLRQWLQAKHQTHTGRYSRFSDEYLYNTLGLVRLPGSTRNLPWANA